MTSSADARPLRVLVCPDSFKGSLTGSDAAAAIAAGVRDAVGAGDGKIEIVCSPVADGGEGSVAIVADHWEVALERTATEDALGRPMTASWAFRETGAETNHDTDANTDANANTTANATAEAGTENETPTHAVIEIAEASGLPTVSDVPPRVLDAHTRGTGLLIAEALARGARSITLCLGGSATVDGGLGIAHALGARFFDDAHRELAPAPRNLARIAKVDISGIDPAAQEAEWTLLADVTNPLVGPQGAAAIFGPQKGASPSEVVQLDYGLASLAQVMRELTGRDVTDMAGAGAAGGVALMLHTLFGARLTGGAEYLGRLLDLPRLVNEADIVFTGEGKLDGQSGGGKVVSYVAGLAAASPNRPPVVCLAGAIDSTPSEIRALGLTAAFSIANGSQSLTDLMSGAAESLQHVSANATGALLAR